MKSNTLSHDCQFNVRNKLLSSRQDIEPERCLSMYKHRFRANEDEKAVTYMSFLNITSIQTFLLEYSVYILAPNSCITNKLLERIFSHSEQRSMQLVDSTRDHNQVSTMARSRVTVDLTFLAPGSTPDIPTPTDLVDVDIRELIEVQSTRRNLISSST